MACQPEHMQWAYRLLLDREIESDTILRQASKFVDVEALRAWIMSSDEFVAKNSELIVSLYNKVKS